MRDRVWFWYPLKKGGYKVVKKTEHGRPRVPSYYRGPFPTRTAAERGALDGKEEKLYRIEIVATVTASSIEDARQTLQGYLSDFGAEHGYRILKVEEDR